MISKISSGQSDFFSVWSGEFSDENAFGQWFGCIDSNIDAACRIYVGHGDVQQNRRGNTQGLGILT
jgi:hypothetical protein